MAMGGNIRVGFEDNFYRSRGVMFQSNAEQVERVVRLLKEFGLEHASPDEAREMLGIKKHLEVNVY
jgi:3-keto-5-aminohexanoate cleavage enzyme